MAYIYSSLEFCDKWMFFYGNVGISVNLNGKLDMIHDLTTELAVAATFWSFFCSCAFLKVTKVTIPSAGPTNWCFLVIREKRSYVVSIFIQENMGNQLEPLRRIEFPNHCISTINIHKPPHSAGWLCQAGTVIMAGLGIARLMMAVVVMMMIVIGPLVMFNRKWEWVNWAWRLALQWTAVAGCIHFVVVGSIFCAALTVSWNHGVSFNDC